MSENEKRPWNVMVYLAGENNLAEECVWALKEIKRALPKNSQNGNDPSHLDNIVRVVAQLDASGLGGNEARYILKRGDKDGILKDDLITSRDTSETSYRSVLKDFVSSSVLLNKSAENYFLVLSGHGNGIISDFLSRDVETPDKLSIPKLRWVLAEVKEDISEKMGRDEGDKFKIDVLGLDSCLMSMAEIGYELRKYVNFMVGAEGFESNLGWPYERVISTLLGNPGLEPKEFASKIVEDYVAYYSDFLPAGRSVDQSACDLSKCDVLASAVKSLADVLMDKLSDPESRRQIVLAHWEAQSYKNDQYVDLFDFCDLLERGPNESSEHPVTGSVVMRGTKVDPRIVEACKKVKEAILGPQGMIVNSRFSGPAVQYSYGLSVYFPWAHVIESYNDLEFAQDTNWKDFLVKYVSLTRREKRPCPEHEAETITGELFINSGLSGFDFLMSNKDVPQLDRVLSNKVGTMKNPALEFTPFQCLSKDASTPKDRNDNNNRQSTVEASEPAKGQSSTVGSG